MQGNLPPLGGPVGELENFPDFAELQRRTLNLRLLNERRRIENSVEVESASICQVSPELLSELLLTLDPPAIGRRRKARNPFPAQR
jgi:hypothetical protein